MVKKNILAVACNKNDAPCVTELGEGACCLYAKALEVPEKPTIAQQEATIVASVVGFPTKKEGISNFCFLDNKNEALIHITSYMHGDNDILIDAHTGITWHAFCNGAKGLNFAAATGLFYFSML